MLKKIFGFCFTLCLCIACQSIEVGGVKSAYQINGAGMEPAFPDSTILAIDENAYDTELPQRGEIVVFVHPRSPEVTLVKRIIGLPGETVEAKQGDIWINGVQLDEPYIKEPLLYNGTWAIGEGEYFVLGDNRNNTSDSHNWGNLPNENIIGKAIAICQTASPDNCAELELPSYE